VDTSFAHSHSEVRTRGQTLRAYVVSLVGPATIAGALIWAILQPYRVTLLHPRGESFWWLVVEPPLLVALVGAIFAIFVARPLIADLEERDAAAR
jgi:hypothetical protein